MSDEDEVKTEITQEMIDYIDVRAPEIDPWAWYDFYGDVLEYLDEYEDGKKLSKKKIAEQNTLLKKKLFIKKISDLKV